MKKEKIALAMASVFVMSAVTATICSFAGANVPDTIAVKYEHGDDIRQEEQSIQADLNSSNDTYSETGMDTSDISSSDDTSSVADEPKFDDPESYLVYDPQTDSYVVPEEEEAFSSSSLFVGDSICMGFWTWGVVSGKNVYATGNAAARNLFDYQMYYRNEPAQFVPVLNEVKPEHVILSMGMNDVNLTTPEEYCENYKIIIDTALENSNADVYVCAITPISNLKFTPLERIDSFNSAIEKFIEKNYKKDVHFIDFTAPFKAEDGTLREEYNGGDGIHLSKIAYSVALHEIYKQWTILNN